MNAKKYVETLPEFLETLSKTTKAAGAITPFARTLLPIQLLDLSQDELFELIACQAQLSLLTESIGEALSAGDIEIVRLEPPKKTVKVNFPDGCQIEELGVNCEEA